MAQRVLPNVGPQRPLSRPPGRLTAEQGVALPLTMMMLFLLGSISAVMAISATTGSHQASRDRGVKRAIAASDAGMQAAVYRMNKLTPESLQCVVTGVVQGTSGLAIEPVQPDGWCRAEPEELGDGASFSYRVSGGVQVNLNGQSLLQRRIVSTGSAGGVSRRTLSVVATVEGGSLFSGKGVISDRDLFMQDNVVVNADAASNGVIGIKNNVSLCGNATPGPGKQVTVENNSQVCGSTAAATQPFVLNPVGTIPAADGNLRIGTLDTWLLQGGSIWNSLTKTLTLQNNAILTLTGNVYRFCRLEIKNNAQILIGPRAPTAPPLKIYIDSPENCSNSSGAGSVSILDNASILNVNSDPTTLQLYVTGSPTTDTVVEFKNNFTPKVNMAVYAPYSYVSLENNTDVVGAIAARQVFLKNNAKVTADSRIGGIGGGVTDPHFSRQSYVECTTVSSGAPDAGCQ